MVVLLGCAFTVGVLVDDKPLGGSQVNEVAVPPATRFATALKPLHKLVVLGAIETRGVTFIFNEKLVFAVHPLAAVTVT